MTFHKFLRTSLFDKKTSRVMKESVGVIIGNMMEVFGYGG